MKNENYIQALIITNKIARLYSGYRLVADKIRFYPSQRSCSIHYGPCAAKLALSDTCPYFLKRKHIFQESAYTVANLPCKKMQIIIFLLCQAVFTINPPVIFLDRM